MGDTALHNAASFGKFDVYDYLVSQGASEDMANEFGNTPKQLRENGKADLNVCARQQDAKRYKYCVEGKGEE